MSLDQDEGEVMSDMGEEFDQKDSEQSLNLESIKKEVDKIKSCLKNWNETELDS